MIDVLLVTFALCFLVLAAEVGKLLQVQNGTPASTSYNGVDALHACTILQQLKALYDEAQLTDIVVEVDHGETFACHRNVLAAISPYFRYMFHMICLCVGLRALLEKNCEVLEMREVLGK